MNSVIKYILLACMALCSSAQAYIVDVSTISKIMPDSSKHHVILCCECHEQNEDISQKQAVDFCRFYTDFKRGLTVSSKIYLEADDGRAPYASYLDNKIFTETPEDLAGKFLYSVAKHALSYPLVDNDLEYSDLRMATIHQLTLLERTAYHAPGGLYKKEGFHEFMDFLASTPNVVDNTVYLLNQWVDGLRRYTLGIESSRNKLINEINDLIKDLTGETAHNIRQSLNPQHFLTAIPEDVVPYIHSYTAAYQANRLIEKLLQFARNDDADLIDPLDTRILSHIEHQTTGGYSFLLIGGAHCMRICEVLTQAEYGFSPTFGTMSSKWFNDHRYQVVSPVDLAAELTKAIEPASSPSTAEEVSTDKPAEPAGETREKRPKPGHVDSVVADTEVADEATEPRESKRARTTES